MKRFALLALLLWVVPIVLGIVLVDRIQGGESSARLAHEPIHGQITEQLVDLRQLAHIDAQWEPGLPLRSGPAGGRVTAIRVSEGDSLQTGDPVLDVDGRTRLALADTPLYRPLRVGDRGADVTAVHRLLAATGFLRDAPSATDEFTSTTRTAVRDLERQFGYAVDGVFEPDMAIFLPAEPFAIAHLGVAVGDIIGTDQPLATSGGQFVDAHLVLDGGADAAVSLAGERVVVTYRAETIDLEALDDPQLLKRAADATWFAEPTDASVPSVVTLSNVSVALATPIRYGQMPALAVLAGRDGTQCALSGSGAQIDLVSVIPSVTPGAVLVPSELIGSTIVVNPSLDDDGDGKCGS